MAKYYGEIGFSYTGETAPGVWTQTVQERRYTGDVLKDYRNRETGNKVNGDLTISNRISIVADHYANEHISNILYVTYLGQKWTVTGVDVELPKLTLTLGGLYNG